MLRNLLAHTSVYTIGSLLTTMAGLVSFPIFTRIFGVDEYGLMSLVSSALLFLVGFAKLGVQHSIVRFHGDLASGEDAHAARVRYFSTVFFGMTATALVIAIAWAGLSQALPASLWNDPRVPGLLLLTAVLVVIRSSDSAMINLLRAQERSMAYNVYAVLKRYGSLAAILATVTLVLPGIDGFYAGTILTESICLVVLFVYLRRTCEFHPGDFSWPLYRAMLAFGIPMIAFELGGIIINLSDRFVIQHFLGPEALGLYSAAYNLCEYVQAIVLASIGQAIVPMYVRLWREKGEAETRRFVQESLHYYAMLGAAVVAGLAAVDEDLLVLLASEKYRAGAVIIPYVAAGMVINGAIVLYGAGLYIHKQTRVLVYLVSACAVLNVAVNFLLVPRLGLIGAAACTLISYTALAALTYAASQRRFPLTLPWLEIAKFCALAGLMYLVVSRVHVGPPAVTLIAKVGAGAAAYAVLVLAFDGRTRVAAGQVLRRMQGALR